MRINLFLKSIGRSFLFLLYFLQLDYSGAQAKSANSLSCLRYYKSLSSDARDAWSREPRAIGDFKEVRYTPTGRIVELKESQLTNQCQTSECYLFSTINFINVKNMYGGQSGMMVSEPFLVAHKFLQHIREGVWYGPNDPKVIHNLRGGFAYEAVHLTRLVGLVPKDVWTPTTPFENWDMTRVYSILETKVPEWNNYIRGLAQKYGNYDAPEVRAAETEANQQLGKIILDLTGPLPKNFIYKEQSYTTIDFEKIAGIQPGKILAIDNKDGYSLPENAKTVLDEAMVNHGGTWKYQVGDFNSIINNTMRFIEAGQPVIFDFNWGENEGHSMLVVGYEAVGNQIVRVKVMNSWGKDYGNDGYVWYTIEDVWSKARRSYKFGVAN